MLPSLPSCGAANQPRRFCLWHGPLACEENTDGTSVPHFMELGQPLSVLLCEDLTRNESSHRLDTTTANVFLAHKDEWGKRLAKVSQQSQFRH